MSRSKNDSHRALGELAVTLGPAGRAGQEFEDTAPLEPHTLALSAEAAARALLRQGEARNTQTSYRSALRYWCAWYAGRYGRALALPLPVPVVVQFIVDHALRYAEPSAESPTQAPARPSETPSSAPCPAGGDAPSSQALTAGPEDRRAQRAPPLDAQARPAPSPHAAPAPSAARSTGGPGASGPSAGAALLTEMPAALDAALVRHGYKTKLGAPSLNTLMHRICVMSKAHQLLRQEAFGAPEGEASGGGGGRHASAAPPPNPCADPHVRELLARTRRAYAQRGERPRRQAALTREPLQRLLDTCDASVLGVRDRALLLFAFASGGRRRSEVAAARIEDLHRVDGGAFVFTLGHSKTNQSAQARAEDAKPVAGSAAEALGAWLAVLERQGVREGALFRRVLRGGHVGAPLTAQTVRNIVRARCELAGVEGAFSAHSLRSGFVTEAARQAVPLADTMAMTGHRSVASVLGYFRAENAVHSPVARLVDR